MYTFNTLARAVREQHTRRNKQYRKQLISGVLVMLTNTKSIEIVL
jgi:hypothetical protein